MSEFMIRSYSYNSNGKLIATDETFRCFMEFEQWRIHREHYIEKSYPKSDLMFTEALQELNFARKAALKWFKIR